VIVAFSSNPFVIAVPAPVTDPWTLGGADSEYSSVTAFLAATYPVENDNLLFEDDVTETGNVEDVIVEQADPPGVFEQAAVAAVYKWKFKPRTVDGRPTPGRAEQLVEFKLQQ